MGHDEGSSGGNLLLRAISVVVPWTALVVVLVVVIATTAEYRSERRSWELGATSTVEATGTPGDTQAFVRVLSDGLNLRSEPSTSAAIIAVLALDQQLVFIEERAGWYRVRTTEGTEGWVAAGGRYTELIQP